MRKISKLKKMEKYQKIKIKVEKSQSMLKSPKLSKKNRKIALFKIFILEFFIIIGLDIFFPRGLKIIRIQLENNYLLKKSLKLFF